MVRSIDLRYEQVRGTHRPNKVARLIGTRVAETILASGLTSCTNRPDIWTQAIRSNLTKLLCHGGRPHMGATSVVKQAKAKGRGPRWLIELLKRKTPKLAAVALANKMARIAWKLMTTGEKYESARLDAQT